MSLNFIDFEVFKEDWIAVIINPVAKEKTVIINDAKQLEEFHQKHNREIYVGHNIRGYDQYIFKGILLGYDPKKINDFIITQGKPGWQFSRAFNEIKMNIYDTMIDMTSLKQLEAFMGSSIEETTVPFDIDRKLTGMELVEVLKYCLHDVEETIKVFSKREKQNAEFNSHLELVKTFNLGLGNMGKTKVQLSAMALEAKPYPRNDEMQFAIPDNKITKYQEAVKWFKQYQNQSMTTSRIEEVYREKLEMTIAGVPHTIRWGGIHGAIPKYQGVGYFIIIDVTSYYPSMMIVCGYCSRNIQDANKYPEIYYKRLEYKKNKDKRQAPFKIVLNGTYGAMKDRNNPLYDPRQANSVCVTGQLWLIDLMEQLEPVCDIIQSNTDGILIKLRATNDKEASEQYALVDDICYEWEQRTGMNLEFDEFCKVYQKDVNNYIIIDKDGNYKSKGAYIKKLNDLDYDLPIVNKALIDYFTKDTPIEQTINNCDQLREFQKIVKLSGKYAYAMHGDVKQNNKCFRVFASKNDGATLYKVKDGKNPEKFANTPEKCFIDNGDVCNKPCPANLDKQWYIELANKRLKDFLGG